MLEQAPAAGLPPAHVGLDAGPVVSKTATTSGERSMWRRGSRTRGPNEILVSEEVAALSGGSGDVGFEEVGGRYSNLDNVREQLFHLVDANQGPRLRNDPGRLTESPS